MSYLPVAGAAVLVLAIMLGVRRYVVHRGDPGRRPGWALLVLIFAIAVLGAFVRPGRFPSPQAIIPGVMVIGVWFVVRTLFLAGWVIFRKRRG